MHDVYLADTILLWLCNVRSPIYPGQNAPKMTFIVQALTIHICVKSAIFNLYLTILKKCLKNL